MKKILSLFILLFLIYTTSISQIDSISNIGINQHFFQRSTDSLSISVFVKTKSNNNNSIRVKAIFNSNSYLFEQEYIQSNYEFELSNIRNIDSITQVFYISIPINIFNNGRYSINFLATDDNWQNVFDYNSTNPELEPITIGGFGFIQAYSNIIISDNTSKFAFIDFNDNLDISSNKLEGIYTQGFCNNELVDIDDFNFHIWKNKSLSDISLTMVYALDDKPEIELSNFSIVNDSKKGDYSFNNKTYDYSFYTDEEIEDIAIRINDKISDIIQNLNLSDNDAHKISFKFILQIGNQTKNFPDKGKLEYEFKVYDLPTGADCQAALLPIDLLKWETHKKGKTVYFDWTTASELNNNYFEVQKSSDSEEWEIVEKINGNGTTNKPNNYSAIDNFPYAGQNYFRLRQADFDGNFKYSKVKSIFVFDNKLKLFPNPTSDYIYYSITDYTKEFKVEIYNPQGEILRTLILPIRSNNDNRIDIRGFKRGTYFIKYYNLQNHQVNVNTFIKI